MRRPVAGKGFAPRPFLRRIERASARMIPYLVIVVVGLCLLNLVVLVTMSLHLPITRHTPGRVSALIEAGSRTMSDIDARLMSGT